MIKFILKLRLKQIFLDSSNGVAIGLRYLMLLFSIIYGVLFGFLINLADKRNPISELLIIKIEVGILILALSFFLVKNYFPQYKGSSKFISTIYPVSALKRALAHLVNDITSSLFLGFGLFYGLFVVMAKPISASSSPAILFSLLSWILVERNLRRLLDFNTQKLLLHSFFIGAFFVGLIALLMLHFSGTGFNSIEITLVYLFILGAAFLHTIYLDTTIIDTRNSIQAENPISETAHSLKLLVQITWKQNKTRVAFIVGFGTKLLLGLVFVLFNKSKDAEMILLYRFLIFSPMIIISHVLANLFGFYRNFWLATKLYGSSIKQTQITLIQFMGLILLFDFVLSLAIILSVDELTWHLFANYMLSIPIGVLIAMYASYAKPFFVEKGISFSGTPNTSPIIGIIVSIFAIGFGYLTHLKLTIWAVPFIILISYLAYKKWPRFAEKHSPLIYDKLFKN